MNAKSLILFALASLWIASSAFAQDSRPTSAPANEPAAAAAAAAASQESTESKEAEEEKLEGWVGACRGFQKELEDKYGTHVGLVADYTGQLLLNGPRREGKGKSNFYGEITVEQKVWTGGKVVAVAQSGAGKGLDPILGTLMSVNDRADQADAVFLHRLYLEQNFLDEKISLIAGKNDLSYQFDTNAVANLGINQFLSSPLVNNPTIPFPDAGMSAVAHAVVTDWLYLMAGVADADASQTETGLHTAFHGPADAFSMYELGLTPKCGERQGNYRFLYWYDPIAKEKFTGGGKTDDMGAALSFDQQITEKLTLFARYGYAPGNVNELTHFWSTGAAYTGLIPGRDEDVTAIGVAQGLTSRKLREISGQNSQETIFEAYYKIKINDLIHVSPVAQVILHPGADPDADVGVTLGIRAVFEY